MKIKIWILGLIILFFGVYLVSSMGMISLNAGENKVNWTSDRIVTARQLIIEYPQIQTITYYDQNNESHGFVNIFGGIGEDFVLSSENQYEINTKSEVSIIG